MNNIPVVKMGIVAVSRDCFPMALSQKRRVAVVEAYRKAGGEIVEIQTVVENELDAQKALKELADSQCNALVVFLGNFGPEGPETLLAQNFDGPAMFVAAAEETGEDLFIGSSVIRDDEREAVARATLDSINRQFAVWVKKSA
jgi:L-fucose isomerase-like protein